MAEQIHAFYAANEPLSPARNELRRLNAELAAAIAEQEAVTTPLRRLEHVVAETGQLTKRMEELRAEHDARIGEWIAAGDPEAERPALAPEAVGVEQRLQARSRDVPGTGAAQPAAQAALQAAVAKVTALSAERADALARAAAEAAEAYAEGVWLPVADGGIAPPGGAGEPAHPVVRRQKPARAAAGRIAELITKTRQRAAVPRNLSAGRRLLDQLAADPAAELET